MQEVPRPVQKGCPCNMEETGAVEFNLEPICVYFVKGKTRVNENVNEESFGMLFVADVFSFEELHSLHDIGRKEQF